MAADLQVFRLAGTLLLGRRRPGRSAARNSSGSMANHVGIASGSDTSLGSRHASLRRGQSLQCLVDQGVGDDHALRRPFAQRRRHPVRMITECEFASDTA
jgi:hypothetical protein